MSMRKFLKQVGVTSQQAIEEGCARPGTRGKSYAVKMVLTIEGLDVTMSSPAHIQGDDCMSQRDAVLAELKQITDPVSGRISWPLVWCAR